MNSYSRGLSPRISVAGACRARWLSSLKIFCIAVGVLSIAPDAGAQQLVPLTLMEAEDRAVDQEPGQNALIAKAEALSDQSVAASALPDPALKFGIANYPIQSGGFTTEGMTQAQIGVHQSFPPGHTRSLSNRKFSILATEMRENADGRGRDVLTAVRAAWLETYYWSEADLIVTQSRPFFEDLVVVTRSLYAVGSKSQSDVLRAELELSRLDDRLIDISRQHAGARAMLAEWVGESAARPIAKKLPPWSQLPALAELRANLLAHPALKAADARVDASQVGIQLAEEKYKPGWALDLGYGYRRGELSTGEPRSDFISLWVTVDLPIFRDNRQDKDVAVALSERRVATESRREMLRRLSSQLEAEYSRWHDLTRRVELYEERILLQSEERAQAALNAYQSETGDFADAMRGYIDALNSRLDHVRLQVERAESYAVLVNLGGLPR